ncbi:MAG: hypothetical protein WDW38_004824 [Sanguina aurantia]
MPILRPLEFLDSLAEEFPELAEPLSELGSLYTRKLWHQLTLQVEAAFSTAAFNRADIPVRLFTAFVTDFAPKINLLKLAQFAVHTSKYFASPPAAVDFLRATITRVEGMKLPRSAEPILFLKMHVAQHLLEQGDAAAAKPVVEAGRTELETLDSVDPSVSAAVHYVASLYYKSMEDYAAFYRSSLLYLAFIASDSLPEDYKERLAVDISLAALLGEGVFSFGQLLQHPIITVLSRGPHMWLGELLTAFNVGDIHKYDELCVAYAEKLNAQPALVLHERRLREKITLMCLLEMVHGLPADSRTIALPSIATATKLSVDGVEFLLMKALSLHLIEGVIDQVDSSVCVSWVQPRILTKPQIAGLKLRLDAWIGKVTAVTMTLENESVGVVA